MSEQPTKWMLVNGTLVDYAEAKVHLRSPAVRHGLSVFEGIRAYWNEDRGELYLLRLQAHWQRFSESMKIMRFEPSPTVPDFTEALVRLIHKSDYREDLHMIVSAYIDSDDGITMLNRGRLGSSAKDVASIAMVAVPYGRMWAAEGLHMAVSSWTRISDRSMPPRIKASANYHNTRLARLQAELDGYDSAVMLTPEGKVSEGIGYTIFMIRRGQAVTPPVTDGILEGITRDALLRLIPTTLGIPAIERSIDRTELYVADEVFVCGTGAEVTPVLSIDRHPIGNGRVGALTTHLMEAYFSLARGQTADDQGWLTAVYARAAASR